MIYVTFNLERTKNICNEARVWLWNLENYASLFNQSEN